MTIPTRVKFSCRATKVVERMARRYGRSVLEPRAQVIERRAREAGRRAQPQQPETVDCFLWLISYRNELRRCAL